VKLFPWSCNDIRLQSPIHSLPSAKPSVAGKAVCTSLVISAPRWPFLFTSCLDGSQIPSPSQTAADRRRLPGQPRLPCIPLVSPSALSGLAFHSSSLLGLFLFLLFIRSLNRSFSGVQATAEPCSEALGSNYSVPCSQSKRDPWLLCSLSWQVAGINLE